MKNTLNILLFLLAGTLVYDSCDALRAGGGSKVMRTVGRDRATATKPPSQTAKTDVDSNSGAMVLTGEVEPLSSNLQSKLTFEDSILNDVVKHIELIADDIYKEFKLDKTTCEALDNLIVESFSGYFGSNSSKNFTVNGDITGWFSHHTGKLSEWYNWGYERKNLNSTEFFNGYKYVLKHFMYDVIAKQSHLNIKPNDISKAVDNKIKMQAKKVVY